MTEKDKRIAIIIGTVILAILLLLYFKRGVAGTSVETVDGYTPSTVSGVTYGPTYTGDEGPWTFNLPGLDLSGPDYSMIGACCSDCLQTQTTPVDPYYSGGGNTYVFNAADQGPTIYNYNQASPYGGKTMLVGNAG
jgi:hypothetical protein